MNGVKTGDWGYDCSVIDHLVSTVESDSWLPTNGALVSLSFSWLWLFARELLVDAPEITCLSCGKTCTCVFNGCLPLGSNGELKFTSFLHLNPDDVMEIGPCSNDWREDGYEKENDDSGVD